jgi:hypothetical protein
VARPALANFRRGELATFPLSPPAVQAQSGHDGGTVDDIEPAAGGDDGSSDKGGASDKAASSGLLGVFDGDGIDCRWLSHQLNASQLGNPRSRESHST